MKRFLLTASAVAVTAASAHAGGLDRSGQPIGIIFEEGDLVEFTLGYVNPSVDGIDTTLTPFNPTADTPIGNVGDSFLTWGAAYKQQINDQWSLALIIDEPYGSDVFYPGDPATTALGSTQAVVDSNAVTAVARFKFSDRFSVHGGLRYQTISANVTLGGLAFGGLNGYNANFASGGEWGYLLGVAYEIPDIALRVALTYNSEITHDLETRESVNGVPVNLINPLLSETSVTEVTAPESLNLSFQSGVAANTLVFGSVRYARYSDTLVSPVFFDAAVDPGTPGNSLTDIDSSLDLELGVARRFNEKWAGRIAVGYERSGDDLVSPLAPTNGSKYITIGAAYNVNEKVTISGGIRYTDLGDALPETGTPDVQRADFSGNSALSAGLRLTIRF